MTYKSCCLLTSSGAFVTVWAAKNARHLEDLTSQLYSALDSGGYLGRSCPWRPVILKTVFKLLDQESPRLLLKLARLILAVSQTNYGWVHGRSQRSSENRRILFCFSFEAWVLVRWWLWFEWSFARLIAGVVTTTSVILSFNKTG